MSRMRSARRRAGFWRCRGGPASTFPSAGPRIGRVRAEEASLVRAALEPLLAERTARTVIHVPFATPGAVFDAIRDLKWSAIGLDLVESSAAWDILPRVPRERTVVLGL